MNKLIVTAALALTAIAAPSALAQGGNEPPAPSTPPERMPLPEFQMPPGPKPLSAGWSADATSADAVQKADALLSKISKVYKDSPTLSDSIKLTSRTPMGEQSDSMAVAFAGDDLRLQSGPMTLTAVAGNLFLEVDGNSKKFLKAPTTDGIDAALESVMPGFRIPVPYRELRRGDSGQKLYDGFTLGVLEDLKPAGFRQEDGKDQILMKGSNGDLMVTADPTSSLIQSIETVFTPPQAPPGLTIGVDMELSPVLGAALASPITAPEANGRRAVATMAELMAPVTVGEPAIDFVLNDSTGREVKFSDLKGSVVVLDFWASWCAPCQRGLPKIDELAKWAASSNKNVKVFGVDVWERVPAEERQKFAEEFWSKREFSFPTLVDAKDSLAGGYGLQAIPVTIVIGLDGNILAVHEGASPDMLETLKADIEKALATAPATP